MNALPNRRVLIIDDLPAIHADFRKVLAPTVLINAGLEASKAALFGDTPTDAVEAFEVDSAYQGKDGLALVCTALQNARPYALAFVDMRMPPGWDGVETIERLWQQDPQLQIVICTAYSDYSLDALLARLDAQDRLLILKKPFDTTEVRQLANALTAKWNLNVRLGRQLAGLEETVQRRTRELMENNRALQAEILERKAVERSLKLKHQAIESSVNAIVLINAELAGNPIEYVNPAFERISGYSALEIQGTASNFLHGADSDQAAVQGLREAISRGDNAYAVLRNTRKDGSAFWSEWYLAPVPGEDGKPSHFVGILNDISRARLLEEQLQHRADYDALTGLPNRLLLMDRMRQAMANAERHKHRVMVAFLDLDRFKFINDSLGHEAGDMLLKTVAERLRECVRDTDTVARLGGDEFVILIEEPQADGAALPAIQRIVERIAQPLLLLGEEHAVTCSIGISVFPHDGQDPESLLKNADLAMYRAKEIGRNQFQFFMPEMNTRLYHRLKLEGDVKDALLRQEFELHYQPQLSLRHGRIIGCEALIRWRHPERGMVPPVEFIPMAEDSDLILRIGEWVMREACRQAQVWMRAGLPPLPIAINISPKQFDRQDVPAQLDGLMHEYGLRPGMIELEITESLSMQDPQKTIGFIAGLRAMGVAVAIDDFGTGYSNLSYIKKFPAAKLKLDRSFVCQITNNSEDMAISSAIIDMGHSLNLQVIAEGVERASQLAILRTRGCDQMQGFIFSAALPAGEYAALLASGRQLPADDNDRLRRQTTVLVCDDEPSVRAALARELMQQPYRLLFAGGAEEGLSMLANNAVDVVMSDHRMPGMTGAEFLRRVQEAYPGVVRILFSSDSDKAMLLSVLNQDTVFKFLCKPWEHAQLLAVLEQAAEKAAQHTDAPAVLVVDDDRHILDFIALALAGQPYQVLLAETVEEAFELLALHHVDVVLSDYLMLGMSGYEFLKTVRKMYPRTMRLMLSAHSDSALLVSMINEGVVFKFMCKPCQRTEILAALDAAFDALGKQ